MTSSSDAEELTQQATLAGLEHQEVTDFAGEPVTVQGESAAPKEAPAPAASAEELNHETSREQVEVETIARELIENVSDETAAAVNGTEKIEMGASSEVESPVAPAPVDAPPENEVAAPRGFLSRLFGKGMDY
jgi:hypothetical protein